MTVQVQKHGAIAVITIDHPPVNAINRMVRKALVEAAADLEQDNFVAAIVLAGAGRAFVGGADITEFDLPVEAPSLPDVISAIEASTKPWVAAVQGVALGGGLELILGCHYRLCGPRASFALPEVSLGIIPGAGGTQRLPRLIGIAAAIDIVAGNQVLNADAAKQIGLVDELIAGDLLAEACVFAANMAQKPLPTIAADRKLVKADAAFWQAAERAIAEKSKGLSAPLLALSALRHGVDHGFALGMANERATFLRLRASEESAALRYLFFAEKAAARPAELRQTKPRPVKSTAVIGGGIMGAGIAAALRFAGLPVVLIERDHDYLSRGMKAVRDIFDAAQRRNGQSPGTTIGLMSGVSPHIGYDAVAACDLVIEAVYEDLAAKQEVFAELSRICGADAILATNTSYLNPSEIAVGLLNPERFVGMHFFSPAHIMKLVEIIPIAQTAPDVIASIYTLAGLLGKIPVRSGICDGFIGNRILRRYRAEAETMLGEGVGFTQIDAAMREFGYKMGPFEMQDLAGLDISYLSREASRARGVNVPQTPGDILVRAGRKGQKTGGGWYDYRPGNRTPLVSSETARLLAPFSVPDVNIDAQAISARLIKVMALEGRAILSEGIAEHASDIDLVQVHGYGFPRWLGGPMFQSAKIPQSPPQNP